MSGHKINLYHTHGPVIPAAATTPLVPAPAPAPVPQGAMKDNAVPVFNMRTFHQRQAAAPPTRSHNATTQAMFQLLKEGS